MAAIGRFSLVEEQQFILATRDTGYRSTASAIAELIDNALQAKARHIQIHVTEAGVGVDRQLRVAVLDDGTGMDSATLRNALRFGGSSRFNDRTGQGRFGMGLPNSSVSQAQRLEVYTWGKPSEVIHSYIDVNQIATGGMREVPIPRRRPLPEWIAKHAKKSGTAVIWDQCDRLDNRKASTVAAKLDAPIGQRFRYFLWDGVKISVNGKAIKPVDPLFVQGDSSATQAVQFGPTLPYELRVPHDNSKTSVIQVRFTELPIAEWHDLSVEEKRAFGISKGGGVSIVRAKREIDFGWYFMGAKRKENYDDWWRCEISFEPELDEYFGVTHSKQQINPTDELRSILTQDLEAIAHTLNSRARSAYLLVRTQTAPTPGSATTIVTERDRLLAPPTTTKTVTPPPAKRRGQSVRPESTAPHVMHRDGFVYEIQVQGLSVPDFYLWDRRARNRIVVTVNRNHPFYERVYRSACSHKGVEDRFNLECLLLAAVRAEVEAASPKVVAIAQQQRVAWSNALAAFLGG